MNPLTAILLYAFTGTFASWLGYAMVDKVPFEDIEINFGAPFMRLERTLLPETDSRYELGTSSRAWYRVFTDELCLTADTCYTAIGGSGTGGSISTSSPGVIGSLLYYTTSGATPELVNPVATGTLSATSPLSLSASRALVGGSAALSWDFSVANTWTGLQTLASGFISQSSSTVTGPLTAGHFYGALTGQSSTTLALATNGANCAAGTYPLGVDASGAAESCTADSTASSTLLSDINTFSATNTFSALQVGSTAGDSGLKMTASRSYGGTTEVPGDGFFNVNCTSNTNLCGQFYRNLGATANGPNVLIRDDDSAVDDGALRIITDGTAGGVYSILINDPAVDIELVESDQASPAGKYELSVQNDLFAIASRNSGDTGFENSVTFPRFANGGGLQSLGIGDSYILGRLSSGTTTATSLSTLTIAATSTDTTKILSALNDTSAEVASLTDEGLLTVSSLNIADITSAIPLADGSGNIAEYAGTSCTNQFIRSLNGAAVATCATVATTDVASGITLDTEWDTESEVQTAWGSVNILLETEIDASSELAALMDDETGSGGALVFASGPTLTGLTTMANASTTGYHTFGTASSTNWTGGGLTDCDADNQSVSYDATTQKFGCGDDDDTGGTGSSKWATSSAATDTIHPAFPSARVSVGTTSPVSLATFTSSATSTDTSYLFAGINDTRDIVALLTDEGLLQLGTAADGISITATDGILSFLGLGNGNDEDLDVDFDNAAADTVDISSDTGVATTSWTGISHTAVNLYASGRASSTNQTVSSITSALGLYGSTGDLGEYTGIDCTNQFVRDVSAAGAGTCATVVAADVSLADLTATNASLTFSGTYNGSTARTIGVNLAHDFAWTGSHDFGGATFLEIPNGTAPTANDPGEIAHDTTDNQIILDDFVIPTTQRIWSVTVASTSPAFISAGLLPIPTQIDGYTVTRYQCHVSGGTSKVVAVEDASANSSEDITCATTNTTDDGSITNGTFTASELAFIDFGATTGTVDYVMISAFGTWTRE